MAGFLAGWMNEWMDGRRNREWGGREMKILMGVWMYAKGEEIKEIIEGMT